MGEYFIQIKKKPTLEELRPQAKPSNKPSLESLRPEINPILFPGGKGGTFRGHGATGSWEEPGLIKSLLTSREDPILALKQSKGLVRGTENVVGTLGSMVQWAAERAKIGDVLTKHVNIPGSGVVAEYLVRKFGPKEPTKFYDYKMKQYAGMGKKWADFWEEQTQKGWEAPDSEVTEARWRDMPITKGVATISEAAPNFLTAIAGSVLTKSPQTGLLFISGLSGAGQYRRQRKKGAGVAKAEAIATMTGAWEYVTEKVPFDEVFKPAKSKFLKMLKLGTMESAQEFVQGIGENFLEYFGYKSKDLKSVPAAVKEGLAHTMDGWVENVVAGAGLGVMGGAIMPKGGLPPLEQLRPGIPETPPTVGKLAPIEAVAGQTPAEGLELPPEAKITDLSKRADIAFKQNDLDAMQAIVQESWELTETPEAKELQRRIQILDGEMLARARKEARPPAAEGEKQAWQLTSTNRQASDLGFTRNDQAIFSMIENEGGQVNLSSVPIEDWYTYQTPEGLPFQSDIEVIDEGGYSALLKKAKDILDLEEEFAQPITKAEPPKVEAKEALAKTPEEPEAPAYIKPSKVESVSQGNLYGARQAKKRAWERIQKLRQKIKEEPIGGNRTKLRVELLKAEDAHKEAIALEKQSLKVIEQRAKELGQTTIKEKPVVKAEGKAEEIILNRANLPDKAAYKGLNEQIAIAKYAEVRKKYKPDADFEKEFRSMSKAEQKRQIKDYRPGKALDAETWLKRFARTEPEFAAYPVFTVKDGMLIFKDGFKYRIEPRWLGLDKTLLKEGQKVRVDLVDLSQPKKKLKAAQPPAQVKKRVISEESYQKAKKRLTDPTKLRMGVDPQGFADLVTIGAYHVENGLRTFAEWSKKMIEVYGEKVRPQLKKVWAQVRPITMEEFNAFPREFLSEQQRTKAEMGEIPSEGEFKSQSAVFNEHLDYFQTRQLPKTSKIPAIQARIRTINGQRLAGTVSAKAANKAIIALREKLIETAIDEGVALRMTRGGKVSLSVRKAGTYVPEEFAQHSFKNISPILGGGQDITRAIQQMDGSLSIKGKLREKGQAGPLERHVLWPTRDISLQKLKYIKEKTAELKSIFKTRKGTKEDEQVNLILEKIAKEDRNIPIKDILSRKTLREIAKPRVIKQAIQLRELYDNLIEEQNLAREMRDQEPIPYRHNYSPQILRDTTIWERVMMRGKKPKDIKADLPDYIKPNAPFNPRAMAREAGIPYEERIKSAQRLAESYLVTAAKDIFNTSIVQNNKAFIQQLDSMGYDKSANYLADWTAEAYAGVKPRLDRALSIGRKGEKTARYFNRLRNMAVFPFNFSWSLLTQTSSLALTVGRYGTINTLRGFVQFLNPNIRKRTAEDYYSYVVKSERQGKITRQDAQNLIGQTVKLRRTPTEIAYDLSTLLLEQLEKLLTGTSIRAANIHGQKRGLTGEALRNYASDGGAKTQSMYNDEDKPALLRNLLVKTGAPYQTFSYEVVNTLREWAGRTGTPPDSKLYTIWTVARFLAAATVFAAIGKKFGKREIWSWKRPPIPFAEFWLSPIIRIFNKEYIGGSGSGLTSPVETAQRVAKGIDDVLETGSWRKLRNELLKYGPGIFGVPGGVQLSRTVDAIIAYAQGGVKDRRGRLLFKMEDPQDLAQAIFSGVYSTKGGRAYLEPEYKWQQMTIAELEQEIYDNTYKEVSVKEKDGVPIIVNGKLDIRYAGQPHRGSEKKVKRMKEILANKKK